MRGISADDRHGPDLIGRPATILAEEAIEKAIEAHHEWSRRLALAIDGAKIDLTVEAVSADDQCEFGRWLAHEAAEPGQPGYEKVRKAHTDFHREAGRVLAMAKASRSVDKIDAIGPGSEFARLSGSLTWALELWRFKLRRTREGLPVVRS